MENKPLRLSPYFPNNYIKKAENIFSEFAYRGNLRKTESGATQTLFEEIKNLKVDDSSASTRKVSKYFQKKPEVEYPSRRRVSPYFQNNYSKKEDAIFSESGTSQISEEIKNLKVDDSSASKKVSKYFQKKPEVEYPSRRRVSPYFQNNYCEKAENIFSEFAYQGSLRKSEFEANQAFEETKNFKVEDSSGSRKVSKYFQKKPEVEEVKVEYPSRRVSPYFQNNYSKNADSISSEFAYEGSLRKCESGASQTHEEIKNLKVEDSCCSRKFSRYFQKRRRVEEPKVESPLWVQTPEDFKNLKVEGSCCSRKVSKYFQKRPQVESPQRVQNNGTKNLDDVLRQFEYRGGSVSSFRECVKKSESKATRKSEVSGNLKVEDSSCSGKVSEYFQEGAIVEEAKVEVDDSSLQKVSNSIPERPVFDEPEVEDFSYAPKVSRYFQKRLKVEGSKVKSNSRRKNPSIIKVEGSKVKSNSRRKNPSIIKPLSKDEKFKEAYKRKTPDNNWKPPYSPWHLIQEGHVHDPWRVLVICYLLNRTTGSQVSQKLMVQGYSGHTQYSGGLDVAHKLKRSEGIRGLYRGFGLSVMTYSPSSAVWWASYGSSQRFIWRFLGDDVKYEKGTPSLKKIVLVQAAGGIIAGATASCVTTPLDTIKTRLQVMGHGKRSSVKQIVKDLINEDGWKGVYRGLGPRFFSMSRWGTSMILAYEYLSKNSGSLIRYCLYS